MTNIDRAAGAAEWKNGLGRSKWQPVTADGKREWLKKIPDMPGFPPSYVTTWEYPIDSAGLDPSLYRSRLRATFVARRAERREAANAWEEE